jgi:2,4-dienoyl-CoA reductase (NADPH2)
MRFPVEIVRRTRERVGPNFIIIYRLSMLDLVEGGSTFDEVVQLAQAIEAAGATIINTGIGWHEARIPTIATKVPRAAFAWVTQKPEGQGQDPADHDQPHQHAGSGREDPGRGLCRHGVDGAPAAGRPGVREQGGCRPADEINTCIGCNQACLDHTFSGKITSCLVNPRACHETS